MVPVVPESILGASQIDLSRARRWAESHNAHERFLMVLITYFRSKTYGVRTELAVAQSAKETGYGHFGGVVQPDFHNWCGLKTSQGGANSDPNAHARFPSDEIGVLAHYQHLALYAGVVVPTTEIVDPRHRPDLRGAAPTVIDLSQRWAGVGYGESLETSYLLPLLAMPKLGPLTEAEIAVLREIIKERT